MKKLLLYLVISLFTINVGHAQQDTVAKALIKGINDMKSGNAMDVLTNFFQAAVQDITGDDKAFEFNSTLFAIKLRGDSSLNIDTNFVRQRFARNLQFEVAFNFKKDFKFGGFTGGVTYAIINNRDKAMADFVSYAIKENNDTYHELVYALVKSLDERISTLPKEQRRAIQQQMPKGLAYYNETQGIDSFPEVFRDMLNEGGGFELNKLNALHESILSDYDSLMEDVSHRALLTISANGKTNRTSGFDQANVEMVYLKGKNVQADIRANLNFKDTATASSDYRLAFDMKGGADIALLRSKRSKKPLIEIKPQLEYHNIFNGVLPGEEKEMFSFNTEIRLRVIEQVWIPLIIKYDIKNQNLLGFLNVSVNLDAFKNFIKS